MKTQGNGFFYEIIVSQQIKQRIKELHQHAIQMGKGQRFLDSLRAIQSRLQQDPIDFSKPLYRLPALHLLVYQGVISPELVY